jgi:uncharacterized membrane protein
MFPGFHAALNMHPMFVHFPIALWYGALLFELFAVLRKSDDWHRTATRLLYLGTLAGIITLFTGWQAENSAPPGPVQTVIGIHETLMVISTSLAGALCIFAFFARKNFKAEFRRLMLLGMLLLAVLVAIGADRGAQMIYQYGAAVNWSTAQSQR